MFIPFQGDESVTIDDLTLENQCDVINIYGNIQITRDQQGLHQAKQLQQFFNALATTLEQADDLPEHVERQMPHEIENPFV